MPFGLAAISTVTATTNATATPSRNATKSRGTIAGSTIFQARSRADKPSTRLTSSRRGSTCCTAD